VARHSRRIATEFAKFSRATGKRAINRAGRPGAWKKCTRLPSAVQCISLNQTANSQTVDVVLSTSHAWWRCRFRVRLTVRPHLPPRHSLDAVKEAILKSDYRFQESVVRRFHRDFGDWTDGACREHIRKLICALEQCDFAWVDHVERRAVDVYGKRDQYGLWYIKFAIRDDRLRLHSCHLADRDMDLRDGRRLRVVTSDD
jgi:hypothetical protein